MSQERSNFSLKARLKSFVYAGRGIAAVMRGEHNMWIHLFVATTVIIAGIYFEITRTEWVLLILCIALVLAAEVFNSAIEQLTNLVSPGHHELAGKTKDMAAGAVLVTAAAAAICGLVIFWPYLIDLFRG